MGGRIVGMRVLADMQLWRILTMTQARGALPTPTVLDYERILILTIEPDRIHRDFAFTLCDDAAAEACWAWPGPSPVGYQPTLATEVAALHARIASVAGVSVTANEAVCVPADDFTDPGRSSAPHDLNALSFGHVSLKATVKCRTARCLSWAWAGYREKRKTGRDRSLNLQTNLHRVVIGASQR